MCGYVLSPKYLEVEPSRTSWPKLLAICAPDLPSPPTPSPMCLHTPPHPGQNYFNGHVVVTFTGNYSWAKCTILDSLVV